MLDDKDSLSSVRTEATPVSSTLERSAEARTGPLPPSPPQQRIGSRTASPARWLSRWALASWRVFSKWFLLPLLGSLVGAMFIGRVAAEILGPPSYKVYVVGSFHTSKLQERILEGLKANGSLGTLDGVPVELQRQLAFGDPTAAQQTAEELASRPDTLMVVGHFSSTATKAALPAYLRSVHPKVPVILTTETNPNLMPPQEWGDSYDPVFRLSPTDDLQAQRAAEFAMKEGARAFLVVEDLANPVYSAFLTQKFCERILEQSPQRAIPIVLRTNNLSIPPIDAIKALKVDWVFFAGGWQNAVILARQVKAMENGQRINILLSDGSVDPKLLSGAGPALEGAYLTYPMLAESYNSDQGSGEYGTNASKIIKQLIDDANDHFAYWATASAGASYQLRRLCGLRSVRDARHVMIAAMNEATQQGRRFTLVGGTECVFTGRNSGLSADATGAGLRRDASFHVWQVCDQKFVEAPCRH